MEIIKLQSVMNGKTRIAEPKKVNGYKYENLDGITHLYTRGKTVYRLTTIDDTRYYTLEKLVDDKIVSVNYDDFHKFAQIKIISELDMEEL